MKTSELTGAALDWAVAKCLGYFDDTPHFKGSSICAAHFLSMWKAEGHGVHWTHSSTDWAEGGPIIERERMHISPVSWNEWAAATIAPREARGDGPTPLIAAMRCYVASKLGDEVDVPEELT